MKDDYEAYEERLLRRKNRWRELRRNLPLKLVAIFMAVIKKM